MIHTSVIGATGYAGAELVRLLNMHKDVKFMHLVSKSHCGKRLCDIYPGFSESLPLLEDLDAGEISRSSDIVFISLPHGTMSEVIPMLFTMGTRIIDLSGDYRYDDPSVYEAWYGQKHFDHDLLAESVYGLPELHKLSIKSAKLVGNPGCYSTCSILALAPLVKMKLVDPGSIIIDAKSGATGAGRRPSQALHFCEVNQSVKAYNVAKHRHTSEIEQELGKLNGSGFCLSFTPHLLPINRGILATCYANLSPGASSGELVEAMKEFYLDAPFVTVYEEGLPELRHVVGSNRAAIGLTVDARLNRVVVVSCIDNLIKGAGGQAIQNMNIMFGLDETEGLPETSWYL